MHPIPNKSPAASRRSIHLPDNYIPTLNPDSTITLPPPHELSIPVLPEVPQGPSSQERDKHTENMKEGPSFNTSYRRPAFPESSNSRREPLDSDKNLPKTPLEVSF